MLFAEILLYISLMVFAVLFVNCCWLATVAVCPEMVARAQGAYSKPWRLIGVGILASLGFIVLGVFLVAERNPVGRYLGGALLMIPVLVGLAGSTCLSLRIGAGLPSPVDEKQPWRRVLRGGLVLSTIIVLPFIGWMFLLPLALFSGVGAVVFHWRAGRRAKASSQTPAVEARGAVAG